MYISFLHQNMSRKKDVSKAKRKLARLLEKITIREKFELGSSVSSSGREYGVSESTNRYIKKIEIKIRSRMIDSAP